MKTLPMKIELHGLVPAERRPRDVGRGERMRWFYVGRRECSFHANGSNSVMGIPTKLLRRALCAMELQVARQRKMRERAKKAKASK